MAKTQMLICPYCGEAQPLAERCRVCRGLFEPLSRQATHNSMGPWYIRDVKRPHRPGCSYETLVKLVERGLIDRFSIIRGPTTRQFWAVAKRVPGVAHLLGYCHNCDAHVEPTHHGCPKCGVPFSAFLNRNHLGLPDIRPLPWEAELDLSDRSRAVGGNGGGSRAYSAYGGGHGNVGISSFATDEELTGAGGGASATASASAKMRMRAPADEPEFVDVPGEEPGLSEEAKSGARATTTRGTKAASAPAGESERSTRALRATVTRQQRTIRLLTILVILVALFSVAFSALLMQRFGGDDAKTQATNANAQENQSVQSASPANGGASSASEPASEEPIDNGSAIGDDEETAGGEAEPSGSSDASTEAASALARVDDARLLLEASEDESRSLDDRIADCEKAVAILETAERETFDDQRPAGLADLLQRARNALERLRLSKFFP